MQSIHYYLILILLTVSASHASTATYTFDTQNRLTKETQVDGTTLEYQYDNQSNRTQLKTSKGTEIKIVGYGFDSLNRLSTVTDAIGTTSYSYDAVGNRSKVTHANGNTDNYVYDSLNRLTTLTHKSSAGTTLSSYTYSLDATGKRTKITEATGRVTDYSYDNLNRLKTETITDATNGNYNAEYTYDKVGNRTYETVDGVQTQYTYDDNDRLSQQGGTTYTYDNNGSTLTETLDGNSKTYSYNAKNQLTETSNAGSTTSYQYNADGIREAQTTGSETTQYIVDSNRAYAQVIEERSNNATTVSYTYGDDLLSQTRNGTTNTYHYDGLGSTRALSDSTGAFTDLYNYEAFGEVLNQTGVTVNDYLFAGEQFDQNLGQYYLRARYYDQGVGRFTQQDEWLGKICSPITLNKYIYTDSNPVNGIDPSGYFTMSNLMSGLNIGARLGTNSVGQYTRFTVSGKGGVTKKIGCFVGVSYIKKQYTGDGNHGHHTIPKNLGGDPNQALLFLPAETHRMVHFVLHVVLKNTPELNGKGNWTSKEDWSSKTMTRNGRKQLYKALLRTSKIVDKFCKLKGPESLTRYVRKGRKSFLAEVK
ncbi:MAG: RHS repeat-associated core domain-containing protein [Cocleimonas sp.]